MGGARQSGLVERIVTYPVTRAGSDFTTDPSSGTVVADSGALGEVAGGVGTYEVTAVVSATLEARVQLEHRNAANDTTLGHAHAFLCATGNTVAVPFRITLTALDERIRLTMNASLSGGDLAASVQVQRVG